MTKERFKFFEEARGEAKAGMERNLGGPFGAVVVKAGKIIGKGCNRVTSTNDPTAHAEIEAIRKACSQVGSFNLDGAELYSTCEPCPMCLGAIYWARIKNVYYASTRHDAADAGFDDGFIYSEIALPLKSRKLAMVHLPDPKCDDLFSKWRQKEDRTPY